MMTSDTNNQTQIRQNEMKTQSPFSIDDLHGDRNRIKKEIRIGRFFQFAAATTIVITFAIIAVLVSKSVSFFSSIEMGWLRSSGWFPRENKFDILTPFVGTVMIAGIAMLVAFPLGLGIAIFLAEYATPKWRRYLKPVIEILAGLPSVVIGFFALTVLSPQLVERFWPSASGSGSGIAAGLGVGIMVVPIIASIAEDSLTSVPRAMREASVGLGARKITTTIRVVIPAALSGLSAAFIVGISRAIGETMIVAIAAGTAGQSVFTVNPGEKMITITSAMMGLASGSDQVTGSASAYQSLFMLGLLLFFLTMILNIIADQVVRRFRQQY